MRRVVKSKYADFSWEHKVVNREPECHLWEGFYSMLYEIQGRSEESDIIDYAVSSGQLKAEEAEESDKYTYVWAEDERALDIYMQYIDDPDGVNVDKHLDEFPIFLQAIEEYRLAKEELMAEAYSEDYDEDLR